MPGRQSYGTRIAAALSVLLAPLGSAACGDAIIASDDASASSQSSRRGVAAGAADEVCLLGRPTGEGIECQAFRAEDGRLYTLIGDLGGLEGDVEICVCGQPVEVSTCMQGTTISITRTGPPDACP